MIKLEFIKNGEVINRAILANQEEAQIYIEAQARALTLGDPAEYEVISTDMTSEIQQKQINEEALAYLASTDWMVIKAMELGLELDATVKQLRQEARDRIQR